MKKDKGTNQSAEENILSSLSKENNFQVPAGYFDTFPEKIMDRALQQSGQKQPFFLLRPSFIIPSVALFTGLIIFFFITFHKNRIVPAEMLLSESEVRHIIENPGLYNIDEAVITEEYISTNIADELANYEPAISDDEVTIYLKENMDATAIINEY